MEKETLESRLASVQRHAAESESLESKMEQSSLEVKMTHLITEKTQLSIENDDLKQKIERLEEQCQAAVAQKEALS